MRGMKDREMWKKKSGKARKKRRVMSLISVSTKRSCEAATPSDPEEPESMADQMFSEQGPGPTTLTGLLNGDVSRTTTTTSTTTSELSYYDSVKNARSLVRTAMRRSRDRESEEEEEERWVSISDVVDSNNNSMNMNSIEDQEVTSSAGCFSSFRLKLDYQQVLNAWSASSSGNPPFYQPLLFHHHHPLLPFEQWSVPENSLNGQDSSHLQVGCSTGDEAWKMELREASLLRYKEKRQSRLFAKRIQYQVRKLNAENRPRIKGRFVKRGVD